MNGGGTGSLHETAEQTLRRRIINIVVAVVLVLIVVIGLLAFDRNKRDAQSGQLAAQLHDRLAAAGLLVESEGALCVFPPGFQNRDGEPLVI